MPGTGRTAVQVPLLRGKGLHRRLEGLEHLALAADHRAEADLQPPHPAGDPHVEPLESLLGERGRPALRVVEVAVPSVDDDVARLQHAGQLVDHRVGGVARGHADDHVPRRGGVLEECLQRLSDRDATLVLRLRGDVDGDLLGPVPGHDIVAAARQAARHPGPHAAQAADRDLHDRLLSLRVRL